MQRHLKAAAISALVSHGPTGTYGSLSGREKKALADECGLEGTVVEDVVNVTVKWAEECVFG